jgi:SPFH domain / Band 7 family
LIQAGISYRTQKSQMPPSNDIKKPARFLRARWFISGCVLLLIALAFAIWGLSLTKLRWDQQHLLVWALPLVSGFSAAAFAGSIIAQPRNWISGLTIAAIVGCAVWLISFYFLFPESKVKQKALGQENSPTATNQSPDNIADPRLSEATEMLRLADERFAAGTGTLSDVISAHQQLTKVELDACRTSDERIAVMTNALERVQELESDINSRFDAGTVPNIDVLHVHQYRLDTEIELGKLKSTNSLQPLWKNIRSFMRWDALPNDYKALLDACVVNGAAAGLIYFLCVLGLYGIAPARFVIWHEWIATAGIPFSERIAKTLAPFLLDTPHTLNAIVLRYRDRARKLFDDAQEVKDRQKWVPAPLLIDDEVLYDYKRPPTLPSQRPYIAGLMELQTHLGLGSKHFAKRRSIVSIEGPGGVGKSALAFQIARWASDSRADYQLARFPILPVLLKSLGSDPNKLDNVDEAAADSLRFIMETSKISAPLLEGLLRRKRVLVVVDGVSEMSKQAADLPIRPDKGAVNTRFLVLTSRLPTNLLESNVIRPQELTIEVLDRVLDDLIAANVGSRRFNDADRETLRMRIRSLIKDAGEYEKERQVPMIFIKLMIERADQLLKEGKQLAELPSSLAELVTEYTEQLLRNEQDLTLAVQQARMAAQVCMGKERSPAARSENTYAAKGASKEILDKFVTAGLMAKSGDKSDPFYKFALDPIAEQLDATRLVIGIRDALADQTEIDDLVQQSDKLPDDFILALRRAAANYRDSICANQPALALKLWPEETKTKDVKGIEPQALVDELESSGLLDINPKSKTERVFTKDEEKKNLPLRVTFRDGKVCDVELRIQYRIEPQNAPYLIARCGTPEDAERSAIAIAESAVFKVLERHTLDDTRRSRSTIEKEMMSAVRPEITELGMTLLSFSLGKISAVQRP